MTKKRMRLDFDSLTSSRGLPLRLLPGQCAASSANGRISPAQRRVFDCFSEEAEGYEKCCKCDHCLNPPALAEFEIRDHEFDLTGGQVRVPLFDFATMSVATAPVTIAFPDLSASTFLADFVTPV